MDVNDFIIKDTVSEADILSIRKPLREYNLAYMEDRNVKDLGIFLENEAGERMAGIIAETHGNWLFVELLWVAEELRGQNIGTKLLKQAEETARERGCKFVFLDTFSFQAPLFYKKQGYKEVFTLTEYPRTGKRHYYTKTL